MMLPKTPADDRVNVPQIRGRHCFSAVVAQRVRWWQDKLLMLLLHLVLEKLVLLGRELWLNELRRWEMQGLERRERVTPVLETAAIPLLGCSFRTCHPLVRKAPELVVGHPTDRLDQGIHN